MVDTPHEVNSANNKWSEISILIVDDHPLIREALRTALEKQPDFAVVGEADNGFTAVELAVELNPQVVIMDISMPKLNGLEAARQIKEKCPNTEVLFLTIHEEKDHIFGVLESGAAGYLTKRIFGEEIIHAIRGVVAGETVLDKAVAKELINQVLRFNVKPVALNAREKLTSREIEIIKFLAKGMSNKEIAKTMELSLPTVKSYLSNVFSKLNINSRWQAVIVSLQRGIIRSDDLKDSNDSEYYAN